MGLGPDTRENFRLYVLNLKDPKIEQLLGPYLVFVIRKEENVVRHPAFEHSSLLWYT